MGSHYGLPLADELAISAEAYNIFDKARIFLLLSFRKNDKRFYDFQVSAFVIQ